MNGREDSKSTYSGKKYHGSELTGAEHATDVVFQGCTFTSCSVSMRGPKDSHSHIKGLTVTRCVVQGCFVGAAIIEDATIQGLKTTNMLMCMGTVFKHVTLKGAIGSVLCTSDLGMEPEDVQKRHDVFAREYYATVDWALDISEADCEDLTLRGVPADLIRRDPDTQMIVERDRLLSGAWRSIPGVQGTELQYAIEFLLKRGDQNELLVAPRRGHHFRELVKGLHALRGACKPVCALC